MNSWHKLQKTQENPYHHPIKKTNNTRPSSYILRFCKVCYFLPYYSHPRLLGMHHVSGDLWEKEYQVSACYRHVD
jgi:hypothetical protein